MTRLISGSLQYTHSNLGDTGMQCYANMSTNQGCVKLVVAMVMILPGALAAFICACLEGKRIRNRKGTS